MNEAPNISKRERNEMLFSGAGAGVVGGLVMAIAFMFYASSMGIGFYFPLKMIGTTFFGVTGLIGGFGVALVGLFIHLVISAFFGMLFALFTRRRSSPLFCAINGIFYGVLIWVVMTFFTVPIFNPTLAARLALMPLAWLVAHVLFGVSMALVPVLRRGEKLSGLSIS